MKSEKQFPMWYFVVIAIIVVVFAMLVNRNTSAKMFVVGESITDPNDPNVLKKYYLVTELVDIADGRFNLTPFLNTTDPYGDINRDGICNATDLHLWDNQWTKEQQYKHRQWCIQVEKKARSVISNAVTYNQLWKGLKWIDNRNPVLVYRIKR